MGLVWRISGDTNIWIHNGLFWSGHSCRIHRDPPRDQNNLPKRMANGPATSRKSWGYMGILYGAYLQVLTTYLSLHRHPEGSVKAEGGLLAPTKGAATNDWAVQTHARHTDTLPNYTELNNLLCKRFCTLHHGLAVTAHGYQSI